MADHYRTELISTAIRRATLIHTVTPGAIFHTDRGSNYTSEQFHTTLTALDIRHSVGRTGVCWDNAMAESFFAALKNELVHRTAYPTRAHATRNIAHWIDHRYNFRRLHSGIGYRTPSEAHNQFSDHRSAASQRQIRYPFFAWQITTARPTRCWRSSRACNYAETQPPQQPAHQAATAGSSA